MVALKKPKIAYLGSCRVARPLKALESLGHITLLDQRNYGYVHSAPECHQLRQFQKSEINIPQYIWPMIGPNADPDELSELPPTSEDLLVVELSSQKTYFLGSHPIQANYLSQYFEDKLSTNGCKAFRPALSNCNFRDFISNFADELDPEDIEILKHLRMTRSDELMLQDFLGSLTATGTRVIVVPHINAVLDDGSFLETRYRFIEIVKRACNNLEIEIFDPTQLMEHIGQSKTVADQSKGLAHFTDDFIQFWSEHFACKVLNLDPVRSSPLWDIYEQSTDASTDPAPHKGDCKLPISQVRDILAGDTVGTSEAIQLLRNGDMLPIDLIAKICRFLDPEHVIQHVPEQTVSKLINRVRPEAALDWVLSSKKNQANEPEIALLWQRFIKQDPPLLVRLHYLQMLAHLMVLPDRIVRLEQNNLKRRAKKAVDDKDGALLSRMSSLDIPNFSLPPEVHLYRARMAYFAEDWTHCVEHGLIALKALPENKGGWIRLSRAAKALGRTDLEEAANKTLTNLNEASA